jgi:hypothetical protein
MTWFLACLALGVLFSIWYSQDCCCCKEDCSCYYCEKRRREERRREKRNTGPTHSMVCGTPYCGTPYVQAQSYQPPQPVQPPQPPHQVSVPDPDALAELASKIHIEFVGGPFDGAHCFDYVDQDVATYQGEIVWATGYKKSYYNFDGQNYFWTERKEGWEQTGYGQPGWELEGEDWREA